MPSTSSLARSGSSRRSARSRSRSVRPSTNSMTMYGTGVPSVMSSPVSYTATIGRVVQRRRGLGLAPEAGLEYVISRQVGTERLDRDDTVQPEVPGAIHLGHATAPDDPVELVATAELPRLSHFLHCPLPFILGTGPRCGCRCPSSTPRRITSPSSGGLWRLRMRWGLASHSAWGSVWVSESGLDWESEWASASAAGLVWPMCLP